MSSKYRVFTINPGSTSTKIAIFDNNDKLFEASITHRQEDLVVFPDVQDQLEYRTEMVERTVASNGFDMADVDVYASRGGGLVSCTSGVYEISDLLVAHAATGMSGIHPAQLGSQIIRKFANRYGKPAFVVNPPDVDEFCEVARVSGLQGIYRESHTHTLNQKEIARRFCLSKDLNYDNVNLIICHIGGGISITAHKNGRMIDSNDIIKGSGPMSPTRVGDIPYMNVLELAFSGDYTKKELSDRLNRNGGLSDYFGTSDVRDVLALIKDGDSYAKIILDGMIYQIAKYVGAMAVALHGRVNAIILTGGISNNAFVTDSITNYISWISEVTVMPGEFELEALASGAISVMQGQVMTKEYTGMPVWNGFK